MISYGGVQLDTTYISPTQVSATVPAILLNYTGALAVLVINPEPNGGASLPATFTVTPKETVASLKPTLVSVGQSFTLTVTGSNFIAGATVQFNGTAVATTFVSATTLTAMVPGALDTAVGTVQVTVVDPFGVGRSALTFTIAVVKAEPPPRPGGVPVTGRNRCRRGGRCPRAVRHPRRSHRAGRGRGERERHPGEVFRRPFDWGIAPLSRFAACLPWFPW